MRKSHEWVLFQVNKTHKTNCPTKKTNSKRKTLNGCCQICIKTVKMSQKHEKLQGGRPWKLGEQKNGCFEERLKMMEQLVFSCIPNFVVISPLPLIFTKMPLWASNVDPLTLLTWK